MKTAMAIVGESYLPVIMPDETNVGHSSAAHPQGFAAFEKHFKRLRIPLGIRLMCFKPHGSCVLSHKRFQPFSKRRQDHGREQ